MAILIQGEDNIIEWIFCHTKRVKKNKELCRKFSELILKVKLRLCQLTGIDPSEIVVLLLMLKLSLCGHKMSIGEVLAVMFWERLATNITRSKRFQIVKELTGYFLTLCKQH